MVGGSVCPYIVLFKADDFVLHEKKKKLKSCDLLVKKKTVERTDKTYLLFTFVHLLWLQNILNIPSLPALKKSIYMHCFFKTLFFYFINNGTLL